MSFRILFLIPIWYERGMKLYVSTIDIKQVRQAADSGVTDGILSDRGFLRSAGINDRDQAYAYLEAACRASRGEALAATWSETATALFDEAQALSALPSEVIPILPMGSEGLRAAARLSHDGIRVACDPVATVAQAVLSAKTGAYAVLVPFPAADPELLSDIALAYDNYGYETLIIATGLSSPSDIEECALRGCDGVATPWNTALEAIAGRSGSAMRRRKRPHPAARG